MKEWLISNELDPEWSAGLIANASNLKTLLDFTESDVREVAEKMTLNIGQRRALFNTIRQPRGRGKSTVW